MLWATTPRGPDPPRRVHVIVETPEGSRGKYALANDHPGLVLKKLLPEHLEFPVSVGCFAQCWGDDGDPLDAMVLGGGAIPPGAIVVARPLGVLRMKDRGQRDDKVLCALDLDRDWESAQDLGDVPRATLEAIRTFHEHYRVHEGTQDQVEVGRWDPRRAAHGLLTKGYARYRKRHGAGAAAGRGAQT